LKIKKYSIIKIEGSEIMAENKKVEDENKKNKFIMKFLTFLSVIILIVVVLYLINYFFVQKSNIKINMSTDKQLVYITVSGKEELIATQKYVSDLNYTMRYDISKFTVFKYKEQDIYKFIDNERILVVVEKSINPIACIESNLDTEYNNCYIDIDNYTTQYYISSNGNTYKITIKYPGVDYGEDAKIRIQYMLNTFIIN